MSRSRVSERKSKKSQKEEEAPPEPQIDYEKATVGLTMSQVLKADMKHRNTINKKIKDWEIKHAEKEERYLAEQAALLEGKN